MKLNVLIKNRKSEFRFLIVGGLSTLIDFIIYMLLSNYIDISVSKCCSMIIASIFAYVCNKNWTFSDSESTNAKKIFKYIISQLINITVNTTINTVMYNLTKIKVLAFVVATGVAMIINYLLQKTIVFRGDRK